MQWVATWRDAAALARFGTLHLAALAVFWVPLVLRLLAAAGIARDLWPFVVRVEREAA